MTRGVLVFLFRRGTSRDQPQESLRSTHLQPSGTKGNKSGEGIKVPGPRLLAHIAFNIGTHITVKPGVPIQATGMTPGERTLDNCPIKIKALRLVDGFIRIKESLKNNKTDEVLI